MKIAVDISKYAAEPNRTKQPAKFAVYNTESGFWQEINRRIAAAKILDASALLASFSGGFRFTTLFDRCVEFGNLAPIHHSVWVEASGRELPARLAVLLQYEKKADHSYLAGLAEQYGLNGAFHWICRSRCFIKPRYRQTIPLKWEWIEYIDAQGLSISSLLKPVQFPEYLNQTLATEMDSMEPVHYQACALIANLGFYAIDLINKQQIHSTAYTHANLDYLVLKP